MSKTESICNKGYEKSGYFRHNTNKVITKCPRCLLERKNPQRVKTHKNLSALDFHLSTEHKGEAWTIEAGMLMKQFVEGKFQ